MTTAWVQIECQTCEWMASGEFPSMKPSEIAPAVGMTECCNEMLCHSHLIAAESRFTCFYCGR